MSLILSGVARQSHGNNLSTTSCDYSGSPARQTLTGEREQIIINVSGRTFITTESTLRSHPDSKLGQLKNGDSVFYDGDDQVFREILNYYRSGELHVPRNMCQKTFVSRLALWDISSEDISPCCQQQDGDDTDRELEEQFQWFSRRYEPTGSINCRARLWYFLTDPDGPYTKFPRASVFSMVVMLVMIVIQNAALGLVISFDYLLPRMEGRGLLTNLTAGITNLSVWNKLDPCQKLQFSKDAKSLDIQYLLMALAGFFVLVYLIKCLSCPNTKYFFTSRHLLDLISMVFEIGYIALSFINATINVSTLNLSECRFLHWIENFFFLAVNLKSFKILCYATYFR